MAGQSKLWQFKDAKQLEGRQKTSVWKCQMSFVIDQVLRFGQEVAIAEGGGREGGGLEEPAAWQAAVTFNT